MKDKDGSKDAIPAESDSSPKPALQVICLGSSGGPSEENVSGFLVRSVTHGWERGSVLAVDAGSHLAAIVRILEKDFPAVAGGTVTSRSLPGSNGNGNGAHVDADASSTRSSSPQSDYDYPIRPEPTILNSGPFAHLRFPNVSARANALHVMRSYISTYLITHPHLDHLSGFAINTAAFHATSKPKTLAALPSTVDAIKQHIFNDVIWPNLSDEDGGVGFVTFQRLKEGGDVMVGEGEGVGYIDVVDGLGVRSFKVSHGHCSKGPPSHNHRGSTAGLHDGHQVDSSPAMARSMSASQHAHAQYSAPGTPGIQPRASFYSAGPSPHLPTTEPSCVVDSTAFFIRDGETEREVLIFGDVEPDSVSLSPRNHTVWQAAARKIAHGVLGGIFIECSYDNSQADLMLFGHLCPRHLIAELQVLAGMVTEAKHAQAIERSLNKKRKRSAGPNGFETTARSAMEDRKRSRSLAGRTGNRDSRRSSVPDYSLPQTGLTSPATEHGNPMDQHVPPSGAMSPLSTATPTPHYPINRGARGSLLQQSSIIAQQDVLTDPPLNGLRVVVIHIKDTMQDGPHVSESVLADLQDHEAKLRDEGQPLGCEFVISQSGESYQF